MEESAVSSVKRHAGLKILVAVIIGFIVFSLIIVGLGRFTYSRSSRGLVVYHRVGGRYILDVVSLSGPSPINGSFRMVLEFDSPSGVVVEGNCSLVKARVVKVQAPLLAPEKYREVMLANISGIFSPFNGRLNVNVSLNGCIEAEKPYKPRIILYPVGRGFVKSVSLVLVRVEG